MAIEDLGGEPACMLAMLDAEGNMPDGPETLRWILVHMIEETARHNGHADIPRELIDGTTGE
jgi:hypothetical protein